MINGWLVGTLVILGLAVLALIGFGLLETLSLRCTHHWHPADAMIAWECCWCGAGRDGMPVAQPTPFCRHAVPPGRVHD